MFKAANIIKQGAEDGVFIVSQMWDGDLHFSLPHAYEMMITNFFNHIAATK